MLIFDVSNLPGDPRENGYVRVHAPDGRAADIRQIDEPFQLTDPDTGTNYDLPAGGFLVFQDDEWSAVKREEFLDGAWDVSDKGVWGKGGDGYPSLFQQDALDHPDD